MTHWFTHLEHGGFPIERAALGSCDLSILHVGGEWQWLVRQAGRGLAEGAARTAVDAQRQAEAIALCCVLVVATFFLPGAATALDVNRAPFRTLSEGATTCGEFVAEPWMQSARMEWVLGYISGRNRESSSPDERNIGSSFQEPATVIAWLQNYCQAHSLDRLLNAADHLRADFQRHEGH
jgi:hypothetical protein